MSSSLANDYIERGIRNPQLIEAALAINEDRLHDAEPILRAHLKRDPLDVAAIRLMAQLAARVGRFKDSETLLRRALELALTGRMLPEIELDLVQEINAIEEERARHA